MTSFYARKVLSALLLICIVPGQAGTTAPFDLQPLAEALQDIGTYREHQTENLTAYIKETGNDVITNINKLMHKLQNQTVSLEALNSQKVLLHLCDTIYPGATGTEEKIDLCEALLRYGVTPDLKTREGTPLLATLTQANFVRPQREGGRKPRADLIKLLVRYGIPVTCDDLSQELETLCATLSSGKHPVHVDVAKDHALLTLAAYAPQSTKQCKAELDTILAQYEQQLGRDQQLENYRTFCTLFASAIPKEKTEEIKRELRPLARPEQLRLEYHIHIACWTYWLRTKKSPEIEAYRNAYEEIVKNQRTIRALISFEEKQDKKKKLEDTLEHELTEDQRDNILDELQKTEQTIRDNQNIIEMGAVPATILKLLPAVENAMKEPTEQRAADLLKRLETWTLPWPTETAANTARAVTYAWIRLLARNFPPVIRNTLTCALTLYMKPTAIHPRMREKLENWGRTYDIPWLTKKIETQKVQQPQFMVVHAQRGAQKA